MVDTVYPFENEFDSKMTSQDIDNIEEAIAEFTIAWQNLTNVCSDMSGDCNEIITELLGSKSPKISWQKEGSLDDIFQDEYQTWLKVCKENILSYREYLDSKKSTKVIRITRPAWISETYKITTDMGKDCEGDVLNPKVIRSWLEDEDTIQLESEISCHMDSSNAIGAEIHEDEFAEITLDEIIEDVEREYDWNPNWKPPVNIKEDE